MRKYTILACVWVLLITFLSLINPNQVPNLSINIPNKDKIVHFMFYFVFVVLWFNAFAKNYKILATIVLVAIIYGIVIEGLQGVFATFRSASFYDVLANAIGALIAMLLLNLKKDSEKKF